MLDVGRRRSDRILEFRMSDLNNRAAITSKPTKQPARGCASTWRILKFDFHVNANLCEAISLYIYDLLLHEESLPFRLYHASILYKM